MSGKDSLTKSTPRKFFCSINQDVELVPAGLCCMARGLCPPTVALMPVGNSQISTTVTIYTVVSTDIPLSGKSSKVTLSCRCTITNRCETPEVQQLLIPLGCILLWPLLFSQGYTSSHTKIQSYLLWKCLTQTSGRCWHCLFRTWLVPP